MYKQWENILVFSWRWIFLYFNYYEKYLYIKRLAYYKYNNSALEIMLLEINEM